MNPSDHPGRVGSFTPGPLVFGDSSLDDPSPGPKWEVYTPNSGATAYCFKRADAQLYAAAPDMFAEFEYLASANDWFGQQRFAEDTDADFLLRVLGAVRTRAKAQLAKALTPATNPEPTDDQS